MKPTPATTAGNASTAAKTEPKHAKPGRIHPVVVYPYVQPADLSDLEELYRHLAKLAADKTKYAEPITVMDRKTYFASEWSKKFLDFRTQTVAKHSHILDAWCVDTCQMWYAGLGAAYERGRAGDVYWLVPGDFNYGTAVGREVLGQLANLPEVVLSQEFEFCVGEIHLDKNSSKQLIDTYGTFALMYHWFPREAQEIRWMTERPRSEFFAIKHGFLRDVLENRWYAYEQTMVILLQAVTGKRPVCRMTLGDISDLPQGRESLASALQQVERAERVLKLVWRERHQHQADWSDRFRALEERSDRIRHAAYGILQNVLR